MPKVFGSDGPAVRSKDNQLWCQAVRGPGPPLQIVSVAHELRIELAGDVTLQDAHDLACGSTFGEAARTVFAGAVVAGHAGEHDPPQGMVRLAVPAGVQTVTVDFSRRRRQWCGATQMRERSFAFQPVWVVACGDQQDRGGVCADTVDLEQAGRAATHSTTWM